MRQKRTRSSSAAAARFRAGGRRCVEGVEAGTAGSSCLAADDGVLTPTDGDLPPTKGDFALTVCVLAISKGDLPPTKDDLAGDEAFVLADNNGSAERGLAPATKGDFTGLPKGDDDAQLGKGDDALPPTTGDAGVEAVGAGGEGVATVSDTAFASRDSG